MTNISKKYPIFAPGFHTYTISKTDKGKNVLWKEHENVGDCFVALAYKDKINGGIINRNCQRRFVNGTANNDTITWIL